MKKMKFILLLLFIFISTTALKSQELNIILSSESDGHTTSARIFGKYLGMYMRENPRVVYRVVPGAAGLNSTNYLYNIAPRDGRTIGIMFKNIPIVGAIGGPNINFDASKFTWIGSFADGRLDASILISNKQLSEDRELIVGSDNVVLANPVDFIERYAGLRMRKIVGYNSSNAIRLAFLRGEVDAFVTSILGVTTFDPTWLERYPVIVQFGNGKNRHPQLVRVPTLAEMVKDQDGQRILKIIEDQFALIRPYVAPPEIPKEAAAELRRAFAKAVEDKQFIEEIGKLQINVNPIFHEEAQAIVNQTVNIDKTLREKLK